MSITLYRKYRPQAWADIAGQNHVKVTLSFEIETGRIAHAYLFSGPRGIGKTTVARILAKAVNCTGRKSGGEPCGKCPSCGIVSEGRTLDIIEIDAASHRGIDSVRDNIIENSRFSPAKLKYKVFIIDEVHMLTTEAFNALLKTLEEPPAHAVFILATTELHKVPPTIVSRCQRFDFKKIPFTEMVERLHKLAEREKVKVDTKTLEEIARNSDGCLRDAEGLLGKVLTVGDGKRVSYDEALVVLPRSDFVAVASFVESLIRRDGRSALMTIDECLEAGADVDQFAGDVIELLRKILLAKISGNPEVFSVEMDEERAKRLGEWRNMIEAPRLIAMVELLLEKRRELKTSHPPQLPLELAVARLCEDPSADAVSPAVPQTAPVPVKPVRKIAEAPKASQPDAARAEKPEAAASEDPAAAAGPEALPKQNAAEMTPAVTATVEKIQSLWPEIMRRAGEENHSLPFLLGVAKPAEICGNLIRIGFNFAFHKEKLNQDKNRRIVEKVLTSILEATVRVEGVILDKIIEIDDNVPAGEIQAVPAVAAGPADALAAAFGGRVVE